MITLEEAESLVGEPAENWKDRCHEVSLKLAPSIPGSKVRRGYYYGTVTKPVGQHSWIELSDGTVLDPTCHAFTNKPPLWQGPADDYDIGGCRYGDGGRPPSYYETEQGEIELELFSTDYVAALLKQPDDLWGEGWILVSVEQVFWLANLPVREVDEDGVLSRFFAAEVYEAIVNAGHPAAIPIDRRKWILDEPY